MKLAGMPFGDDFNVLFSAFGGYVVSVAKIPYECWILVVKRVQVRLVSSTKWPPRNGAGVVEKAPREGGVQEILRCALAATSTGVARGQASGARKRRSQ